MTRPNKFGKSFENIKQASQQDSKLTSNLDSKKSSKQASKLAVDFKLDGKLESKEQAIVTFRTAPSNRQALRQAALLKGISLTEMIKEALVTYLDRESL